MGDQPWLALRQDGRVMTVTLSREKHTVTNARGSVRHERSDAPRSGTRASAAAQAGAAQKGGAQGQPMPVVAVTGAARGIGRALTVRLAASPGVKKVIAIDSHRGDIAGVTWRVADVRDPALAGRLAGADIVVHADYDRAPAPDARRRGALTGRGARPGLPAAPPGRAGRGGRGPRPLVSGAGPESRAR